MWSDEGYLVHITYHFSVRGRIARINRERISRCENSTRSVPIQGIAERRLVITVAKSLISTISLILNM